MGPGGPANQGPAARRRNSFGAIAGVKWAISWIDQAPDGIAPGAVTVDGEAPVRTVEPRICREAMSRIGAAGPTLVYHERAYKRV